MDQMLTNHMFDCIVTIFHPVMEMIHCLFIVLKILQFSILLLYTHYLQLIQKRLSFKNLKPLTLSAQEMLGNFYLEPKTQEFYIATTPGHIINTDSV